MKEKTTKRISVCAALLLAFTMLLTAFALSTGIGKTRAFADGEQGKLLYVVDCGRVNGQDGKQLPYGYDEDMTPTYINKADTFIKRIGGKCKEDEVDDRDGKVLTLLCNSYTDRPFGADPDTGKYWGFNDNYSEYMQYRLGRAGDAPGGYSEFRAVNDGSSTSERLTYKFEVLNDRPLYVTVITRSPDNWGTINGKMSVNGGNVISLVATENAEDHSIPNCKGVLNSEDNRYYLTLTFGEEDAQTVVNGIIIREAPFSIAYYLGGGTNNAANKASYTYGFGFTLADPTRKGYTFDGWYDAENGGNKVTAISDTQTGNVTLYARWSAAAYTITYNLGGGTNNAANKETYTYGAGFALADPTRTGYTFDGWYDAENGGNKVTAISDTQTGNVTLYARWNAPTYTVTYNLGGGTNDAANKETYTYGAGFTLADPTRTGYTFDGWYDAENGGNKVTAISDTQTGDVTLYARWTENTAKDDTPKSGCNSNISDIAPLFFGFLLLSAGAIVMLKCKKN